VLNGVVDDLYEKEILRKVYIGGKFKKVEFKLRERPTPISPAFLMDYNSSFVKFVKKRIESKWQFKNYNMGYSVADENVFSKNFPNIPVLVLGPIGENSHKEDEWVCLESLNDLKDLFIEICNNFLEFLELF